MSSLQSKHIQAIQYTSIHINTHQYTSLLTQKKYKTFDVFHDFLGIRCGLCGPWPPEATTTSTWRPGAVTSGGSATSCGRCPAPRPRRTATGGPRCTSRRRATATRRSARCCWRRGPRWTPGTTEASRLRVLKNSKTHGSFVEFA